jgi:hypothetical protein
MGSAVRIRCAFAFAAMVVAKLYTEAFLPAKQRDR